jgi:predicted ArsR family transcriptional regulator
MDNVVVFPLRGRLLLDELTRALDAADRPMLTHELADALGVSMDAVLAALQELQGRGRIRCVS